jgi:hypothetical protein
LVSVYHVICRRITLNPSSILQAVRITGSSMDHNFYTVDLGRHHVPSIHDRDIRAKEGVHRFLVGLAPPHWHTFVVVVYNQDLRTAEQAR